MNKKIRPVLIIAAALMAGCGKDESTAHSKTLALPPVFVAEKIEGTPIPIPEARKQFQAGDQVLLTGLVMGVPHPFVNGRSVFVLGDEGTLIPCDLKGDDHCPMPWDNCCDPSEAKTAGTATIQVVDDNGKPLKTGLKGINGLKELSRVTIAGTVAPNSSSAAFIVNADKIHIGKR